VLGHDVVQRQPQPLDQVVEVEGDHELRRLPRRDGGVELHRVVLRGEVGELDVDVGVLGLERLVIRVPPALLVRPELERDLLLRARLRALGVAVAPVHAAAMSDSPRRTARMRRSVISLPPSS